jgi:hypothetical protein
MSPHTAFAVRDTLVGTRQGDPTIFSEPVERRAKGRDTRISQPFDHAVF